MPTSPTFEGFIPDNNSEQSTAISSDQNPPSQFKRLVQEQGEKASQKLADDSYQKAVPKLPEESPGKLYAKADQLIMPSLPYERRHFPTPGEASSIRNGFKSLRIAVEEDQFDQRVHDMVISGAIDKDIYHFSDWVDPRTVRKLGHAIIEGNVSQANEIISQIKDKEEVKRTIALLQTLGLVQKDRPPIRPAENKEAKVPSKCDTEVKSIEVKSISDKTTVKGDSKSDRAPLEPRKEISQMMGTWRTLDNLAKELEASKQDRSVQDKDPQLITIQELHSQINRLNADPGARPYHFACLKYMANNFNRLANASLLDGTPVISTDRLQARVDNLQEDLLVKLVTQSSREKFPKQYIEQFQQLLPSETIQKNPHMIERVNAELRKQKSAYRIQALLQNNSYYLDQPKQVVIKLLNTKGNWLDSLTYQ